MTIEIPVKRAYIKGRYKTHLICFLVNCDKLRTLHNWLKCVLKQLFLRERDYRKDYSILIGNTPLKEKNGQNAKITRALCSKTASEIYNFLSHSWKNSWLLQVGNISFWASQSSVGHNLQLIVRFSAHMA